MVLTQRDIVEKTLLDNFKNTVKPLGIDDIETINKFKDGSFGFSYLAMLLYMNGYNLRGKSSKYPKGLLYYDNENIFGIGFFKKEAKQENGHLHIVAPRGTSWLKAVDNFIKHVRNLPQIPSMPIYIRHLNNIQYKELLASGYLDVENNPWHPTAPREDETYSHRFIKLKDMIEYDKNDKLVIKVLQGEQSKNFRKKARSAYLRFENFLTRNKLKLDIQLVDRKNQNDAENILKSCFAILNSTKDEVVLSTVEDYLNIVRTILPNNKNDRIFFTYIGYLKNNHLNIPIMVFAGEKIDDKTVALYATFSLRDKNILPVTIESKGFTAISQYCYLRMFDILYKYGIQFVDLGGSEVEDLDIFKRQLGAHEKETFWVIRP